jgi:flagellar hook-associated protein 3 FlgL
MTQAESTLGQGIEVLQQAREALAAAGNASYSHEELRIQAQQLQQLRDQLLAIANTPDGKGGYVFSGQGVNGAPFVDQAPPHGPVVFTGVPGQLAAAGGDLLPLTVDGVAAWMSAPTGNGVFETVAPAGRTQAWISVGQVSDPAALTGDAYSVTFSVAGDGTTTYEILRNGTPMVPPVTGVPYESGSTIEVDGMSFAITGTPADGEVFGIRPSSPSLSVFDALDRAIAALNHTNPPPSSAEVQQLVSDGLNNVDALLVRMTSVRSAVGDVLNRLDHVEGRNGRTKLEAQTDRSRAEDLDMIEGLSDFQNQQTGYDAVLKIYSQVQRMSLFNYIA